MLVSINVTFDFPHIISSCRQTLDLLIKADQFWSDLSIAFSNHYSMIDNFIDTSDLVSFDVQLLTCHISISNINLLVRIDIFGTIYYGCPHSLKKYLLQLCWTDVIWKLHPLWTNKMFAKHRVVESWIDSYIVPNLWADVTTPSRSLSHRHLAFVGYLLPLMSSMQAEVSTISMPWQRRRSFMNWGRHLPNAFLLDEICTAFPMKTTSNNFVYVDNL